MSETDDRTMTTGPQRWLAMLASIAVHLAALAMLGLVAVQGWQVFARYVINDSPGWTEPVTILLLTTAMSLGAAAAVHSNRHFGFFLLAGQLGPRFRSALEVLIQTVVGAIGAVLAWWAWMLWMDGLHIKTAGADFPQSINYLPLSIGGALMLVFAVNRMILALRPAATEGGA
ncbi:MAG TPA: TRAP transporter small permease [Rhodanobacter sp.]|nr:TRAP transporter small permease [Rhodanobacter sp.]